MSAPASRIASPPPYSRRDPQSAYRGGNASEPQPSSRVQEISDENDIEGGATAAQNSKSKRKPVGQGFKEYFTGLTFSHAWFLFFSIASMALTICVLTGCRTPLEWEYDFLQFVPSVDSSISDEYRIGLSGICRSTYGSISCAGHFPYRSSDMIDIISEEQYDSAGDSIIPKQLLLADQFIIAIAALLLGSIFINLAAMLTATTRKSGFSKKLLWLLIPDLAILLACNCLIWPAQQYYSVSMSLGYPVIGVGIWLLIAASCCRLISHLPLFKYYLILCLSPLILLGACCIAVCEDDKSSQTHNNSSQEVTRYNGNQEVIRYNNDQTVGVVGVEETTFVARDDEGNAIIGRIRTTFALFRV